MGKGIDEYEDGPKVSLSSEDSDELSGIREGREESVRMGMGASSASSSKSSSSSSDSMGIP
jgi:hypothetical protein